MSRYQNFVHICVFLIIIGLAFNTDYNPFVTPSINTLSEVVKNENALYKEVLERSNDYTEAPQDAYIDSVWKKTPGRNGLKVNIEKSYKKMESTGIFDESLLVYEQTSPEITLKDLPASPIYRGHPEKEMVALLINVSWGSEHIPAILNILKEKQVKATFFIEGKWARDNADYVKMIDEQGHVIGNHAYNHPDMARLSNQKNIEQISQTNEIIKAITGKTPLWFAPPSGSYNDHVVLSAHNLNMETILWTVDTIDWKNPTVNVMINRVNSKIHPGATILMHPTPSIVEGLSPLIDTIQDNGYKIGTIENLLNEER
ncbi:polysaccharide deacetylase family protein [Virgibacillus sp. C22-A2]|uniref:Polysaccharide deacetylase family protein n=1 Tax=Virgibacillus tibetensis TaxID=3042313 RepID=A0ABU6KBT9_9BACI|nr:polysaccharide deacetylase family protein [Virgibacillus sp. C22-A2]